MLGKLSKGLSGSLFTIQGGRLWTVFGGTTETLWLMAGGAVGWAGGTQTGKFAFFIGGPWGPAATVSSFVSFESPKNHGADWVSCPKTFFSFRISGSLAGNGVSVLRTSGGFKASELSLSPSGAFMGTGASFLACIFELTRGPKDSKFSSSLFSENQGGGEEDTEGISGLGKFLFSMGLTVFLLGSSVFSENQGGKFCS